MSTENSTANQTVDNFTNTTTDYAGETATFFDPLWQTLLTVGFYFQYSLVTIGIFGTAANALVLYALFVHNAQEAKKRAINLLIINQNLLDLTCCILLVVTFSIAVNVNNMYLTGVTGYLLCTVFITEGAAYSAQFASTINLMALTIERYLKVVHPFWSKKNLKHWMIHAAMVFAWISGNLFVWPAVFLTSFVQDGRCLRYFAWNGPAHRLMYAVIGFFCCFLFPLITFIYCYSRIVVVMRRQMKVMAGHNVHGSSQMNASQIQSKRIKWNIIKTMIIVSVAFTICWFPVNIYFVIVEDGSAKTSSIYIGYYPMVFLAYLNICMNPFIYATKHEGVKHRLTQLMVCHRCKRLTSIGDNSQSRSNIAGGTEMQQLPAGISCP